VLTNDFGMNWNAGDPANGISPLADPFPIRADGTRFDVPFRDQLGSMALAGQGFAFTPYNRVHPRVQRWRIGIQRELTGRMMIEASYWGQWADRVNPINPALSNNGIRLDALPEQYWATGTVRNNDIATDMNRQVPNPYYIGNFESLRTSDPLVYQYMSTLGTFTQPTIAKNRLLRPHSHMNG